MADTGDEDKFKIVFLGDLGVGKTSIVTRFMYEKFEASYHATVGIDFLTRKMEAKDRTIKLQIWDTAGQERFRSLIPNYLKDSDAAVIVFDISNRDTLNNIDHWASEVKKGESTGESIPLVYLVGNKLDLKTRQITEEEGQRLAKTQGFTYFEVSAKQDVNIKPLFDDIGNRLPRKARKKQHTTSVTLPTGGETSKKGGKGGGDAPKEGGCC